jgi:cellulose 1,4-beta-cellobiosidase
LAGVTPAGAAQGPAATGCGSGSAAPGQPGTPRVTSYRPNGVGLEWPPSAPGSCPVAGYRVYGTLNGSTTQLAEGLAPFVSITGLADKTYVFQIVAVDSAGAVSVPSASITVPISAIPPVSDSPCPVTYTAHNSPGAFTLTVSFMNEAYITQPINGWTLSFPMGGDQRMTSASNATVTQTGPQVTATSVPSDALVPFFRSATFEVQGTWSTSDAPPGPAALTVQFGTIDC